MNLKTAVVYYVRMKTNISRAIIGEKFGI